MADNIGRSSSFALPMSRVRWIDLYTITFPVLRTVLLLRTICMLLLLSTILSCKSSSALYRQADVMSQCFELFYREHIRPLLPVSSVRRLAEFEQKLVRNLPMQQQILSSLMSSKAMVKNVQRVPGRDGEKFNDSATASIEEGKRFTEQQ